MGCGPEVRIDPAIVARALDTPRVTLTTIGHAIGVSRYALEKYRDGQRAIPEARLLRLLDYLEGHARSIQSDVDALRATMSTVTPP